MEKVREVHPFSLFYDTVFVYAIACMTQVIEHTSGGWILAGTFCSYLLGALAVLQVWLYQTNYSNRFGKQYWYENVVRAINMMAVLYLANNLGHDGIITGFRFSLVMILMLGDIGFLYLVHAWRFEDHRSESLTFAKMIGIVLLPYVASLVSYAVSAPVALSVGLTVCGSILGIVMPFVVRKFMDSRLVDFHHLTERFELLTILSFGETILAVGKWFRPDEFGLNSIVAFCTIVMLFACYYFQMHILIDRTDRTKGLVLMYSHYVLILGLDLLAAGQNLLLEKEILNLPFSMLMACSLVLFFGGLYANSIYYSRKIWTGPEMLGIVAVVLAGITCLHFMPEERPDLLILLVVAALEALFLFFQARKVGFDED